MTDKLDIFPSRNKSARYNVRLVERAEALGVKTKHWTFLGDHCKVAAENLKDKLEGLGLTVEVKKETDRDILMRFFDSFRIFEDLDPEEAMWEIAKLVSEDDLVEIAGEYGIHMCPEEWRRLKSYCL